jgi:hypothetical protein
MPQSLRSPRSLGAVTLAQAIARARELCFDAQIIISKAAARVAESKRGQSERRRWRAVWSRAQEGPDRLVVCCVYCARVRAPDGEWGAIPAGLSQVIHQSPTVCLSHGICGDCMARHFPR